jgi:conjugal transfer ATP-binding protein TraC
VREQVNPDPGEMYRKPYKLDPYQDLNYQCVDDSFDMQVTANHLKIGLLDRNGKEKVTRVTNYHLARDPEIAFLWTSADNYANLLNPELSISCPFVITLTLMVEDQVKTQNEANLKYLDLEKKAKPLMRNTSRQWKKRFRSGGHPPAAGNQSVLSGELLL